MGGDEGDGRIPPDTFLGQATYVSHTGSKPMNIVWKLEKPIPAKYLRKVQQVMGCQSIARCFKAYCCANAHSMTGNLNIQGNTYPGIKLIPTYNDTTNRGSLEYSFQGAASINSWDDDSGNNRRAIEVRGIYPFFFQLGKTNKRWDTAFLCCCEPFLPAVFSRDALSNVIDDQRLYRFMMLEKIVV